ncbi:MAG: LysM peptidoglycan-binding domain-containing protein [Lachnospiraceae bacterium]|nr:LysM peptidoglycan-binding domain-containing protein [Lachnospiraceae bacterium]
MNAYLKNRKVQIIAAALIIAMITVVSGTFAIRSHAESVNAESDTVYYRYTAMYRVCSGDTLTSIAEQYMDDVHYDSVSDYVKELRQMNGMYNDDKLKSGELIAVTYYSTEYK